MTSCSWLGCDRRPVTGAVWRTTTGKCIVVASCDHHGRLPSRPETWVELVPAGDPRQLRQDWHNRYR